MENKKIFWKAEPVIHKGRRRIAVYFELNAGLVDRIKKFGDVRWSNTLISLN